MNSKHLCLIQTEKKIFVKKKKLWTKAISERGTEEDHQKFCKLRKDFKKLINDKMRLNVEDKSDISLISKKFWKYVKSKTNLTRIPETVCYKINSVVNQLTKQTYLMNSFSINFR